MKIPLQQTHLWYTFLTELGETSFLSTEKSFSYLAIFKKTPLGNYLYCPYGPYSDTKKGFLKAIETLKTLAKSKNAIFIRIEPQDPKIASQALSGLKAKKVLDLAPAHTLVLDLSPKPDSIIANFSSTTRNRFNTTTKRGLKITTSTDQKDLKHLIKFQDQVARSRHFHAFSKDYLKTELKQPFATLYLAHFTPASTGTPAKNTPAKNPSTSTSTSSKVVGASLFFDHLDTRYYMQSGTDLNPKYKSLSANVSILGQAILDAKAKGLKYFDFWGIAPENAPKNHPWIGFTKFKKTFGGTPVAYCGTHDLILKPLNYHFYHIFRKLNRLIRKSFQ